MVVVGGPFEKGHQLTGKKRLFVNEFDDRFYLEIASSMIADIYDKAGNLPSAEGHEYPSANHIRSFAASLGIVAG